MASLLEVYKIKNLELKNRVIMSPMCMYSANNDGIANEFHYTHYQSRAIGQVGLIIIEATAVLPEGRITENDLGIWQESQLQPLSLLVDKVHQYGSKIGIQLAHAGRKSTTSKEIYAPSALAFNDDYKLPLEMTLEDIEQVVQAFILGAKRAVVCGFDVIEIHGAHGYLINEFLSVITNLRKDQYGGSLENRYRLLKEIIVGIKSVYDGPLFVRISADEYSELGNTLEDYVQIASWMKEDGVDVIDVSTGGLIPVIPKAFPGYQVPYAQTIKEKTGLITGAVGMILDGVQAQEILDNNQADLIFIGRELLRNSNFVLKAGKDLGLDYDGPFQYERAYK